MGNMMQMFQDMLNQQRNQERQNLRPMKEHYNPGYYQPRQALRYPELGANFELKPTFIALLPTFRGLPNEDPYDHVDEFLTICDTLYVQGVSQEAIRLRAFPFTLKEKAKYWCRNLDGNIDNWEELKNLFLKKFFPIGKLNALRQAIETFSQTPNEHFHNSWERFKESVRKCPNHGIPKHRLIQYFYNGIDSQSRGTIDAACGGYVLESNEETTWRILENMSESSRNHESHQTFERYPKKQHVQSLENDNTSIICAQLDKITIDQKRMYEELDKKIESIKSSPKIYHESSYSQEANWVQKNQFQTPPNMNSPKQYSSHNSSSSPWTPNYGRPQDQSSFHQGQSSYQPSQLDVM